MAKFVECLDLQFIGGLVDTFFIHVSFPLLTGVDEAIRCQAVHNAGQTAADGIDGWNCLGLKDLVTASSKG